MLRPSDDSFVYILHDDVPTSRIGPCPIEPHTSRGGAYHTGRTQEDADDTTRGRYLLSVSHGGASASSTSEGLVPQVGLRPLVSDIRARAGERGASLQYGHCTTAGCIGACSTLRRAGLQPYPSEICLVRYAAASVISPPHSASKPIIPGTTRPQVRRADPRIVTALIHRPMYLSQLQAGEWRPHPWWQLAVLATLDFLTIWAQSAFLWYLCGNSAFSMLKDGCNRHVVEFFQSRGVQILLWTVNDPDEKAYFTRVLGCDIITDTLLNTKPEDSVPTNTTKVSNNSTIQ